MKFKDFSGGLNLRDNPTCIADNEFVGLTNFTPEEGYILKSRGGFLDLPTFPTDPDGMFNHGFPVYKNSSHLNRLKALSLWSPTHASVMPYLFYTISSSDAARKGLYMNTTRLTASITDDFCCEAYNNIIYITDGKTQFRVDGSERISSGITSPRLPKIETGAWKTKVIDNFEDLSDWETAKPGGMHADTDEKYEGTQSLAFGVDSKDSAKCTRVFPSALNLNQFSDGTPSGDYDFITFHLKAYKSEHINSIKIDFGLKSDSSDWTEYYTTDWITPGMAYSSKALKSQPVLVQQVWKTSGIPMSSPQLSEDTTSMIYIPLDMSEWTKIAIPKCDFKYNGSGSSNWSTVYKIRFWLLATNIKEKTGCNWEYGGGSYDDAGIWIDLLCLEGAGGDYKGLTGKYYFCTEYYSQARDEYYAVSEESDAVEFFGQSVKISAMIPYASVPKPADTYLIWARPENDDHWYLFYSQTTGNPANWKTATSFNIDFDTLLKRDELTSRTGVSPMPRLLSGGNIKLSGTTNNTPPPVANVLCMHKGIMFYAVGNKIYHSKPGQPHAVPEDNWILCPEPVVAMRSDGTNLLVWTSAAEYNYVYAGEYQNDWMYLGYITKSRNSMGCVSSGSVDEGVFCSRDGIYFFDGVETRKITDKLDRYYKRLDENAKKALTGRFWKGKYILLCRYVGAYRQLYFLEKSRDDFIIYKWTIGKGTLPPKRPSTIKLRDVSSCTCDGRLYLCTSYGMFYYYDGESYNMDYSRQLGGNIPYALSATSKIYEYAPENKEIPLERFSIYACTATRPGVLGENYVPHDAYKINARFFVDGVQHGSLSATFFDKVEKEGFMDLGAIGSRLQWVLSATFTATNTGRLDMRIRTRIYDIEVS